MTELKTLKDLEFCGNDSELHICKEEACMVSHIKSLRAEAIKWIKELEKYNDIYPYPLELEGYEDSGYDEYSSTRFSSVINFIKHFFDITDEELK